MSKPKRQKTETFGTMFTLLTASEAEARGLALERLPRVTEGYYAGLYKVVDGGDLGSAVDGPGAADAGSIPAASINQAGE